MGSVYNADTLDKRMIHILGGTGQDGIRLHISSHMQFKTYELFISRISHLATFLE
jgi:hypothetical protein